MALDNSLHGGKANTSVFEVAGDSSNSNLKSSSVVFIEQTFLGTRYNAELNQAPSHNAN
ncbi:MAG: hypothetical protein H7Y02_10815 [Candidatus Obscuribacterales bacterium]|nr:hypothetical protein [Steroidobacteraceae bacterium]